MAWLDIIIQGLLVGGLYAMFAAGLALIFGVMRLVNVAHGDFTVLAAYMAYVAMVESGLNPLIAVFAIAPLMGLIGYALQRLILNRTLGDDILPPLLVTFGLSIVIQNGLLEVFSADSHRLTAGAIDVASLNLGSLYVGVLPLIQVVLAIAVIGGLQFISRHTALGRAFRAVSDDQEIATLMGLNNRHIYGLAMAISLAIAGLAGVLLAIRSNFDPSIGPSRLIFGFEAVIIGGLGNIWGTLAGGLILGVVQALGAELDPGWQTLAGHLVFLAVLAVRPRGLFAKTA
jgi:branched-chain amino acid transport system permease protein